MKQQELFEKTVGILVDAYHNGTLKHQSCMACAVGNMVRANMGEDCFIKSYPYSWATIFNTIACSYLNGSYLQMRSFHLMDSLPIAREQIESTGYPVEVLADIEYAFETALKGNSEDEWMLNGLYRVYDVLCAYHEVEAPTPSTEVFNSEEKFTFA